MIYIQTVIGLIHCWCDVFALISDFLVVAITSRSTHNLQASVGAKSTRNTVISQCDRVSFDSLYGRWGGTVGVCDDGLASLRNGSRKDLESRLTFQIFCKGGIFR